jgi:2-oxoglutarate ferredoxin oxidoreductase subunit beta
VARSFAGDPVQVRELLKAALSHRGTAVIDIISPCVSFNNREDTLHSYQWGRQHQAPLHDIAYVPRRKAIILEEFAEGDVKEVVMHDGSVVVLKKLEKDYDPTDKWQALKLLEEADRNNWLVTGLIYVNPDQPSLYDDMDLVDQPLNRIKADDLRPSPETLEKLNQDMY